MEAVVARIKELVIKLYPTILADLDISEEYLDVLIQDVVDRALIFMNRDQLVYWFEKDLIAFPQAQAAYEEFWACYEYPIPPRLESTLAKVVIESSKTILSSNTSDVGGAITGIKDNGQEVTYSSKLTSFFNSSDDATIFSGSLALLKRYLLGTVIRNDNSRFL
jgi:hypothetical protein